MMIEEKTMSAMINAEQRGVYAIACAYAEAYCKFLSVPDNKFPQMPMLLKTDSDKSNAMVTHYFNLLNLIMKTASDKIAEVRVKYNKKSGDLLK